MRKTAIKMAVLFIMIQLFVFSLRFEEIILDRPELFGEVNVIVVRILKTKDLIPHSLDLCLAMCLNLVERGALVNLLSTDEDRLLKLGRGVVFKGLSLPGMLGIKELERLCEIDLLVVYANKIRLGFAVFLAANSVYLLEMGRCDLTDVFTQLDLRHDGSVGLFNSAKLVYTAENGLALRGDESLADSKGINARTLTDKVTNDMLVK